MPFERTPGSNPRGGPLSAEGWKYVLDPARKAQQTRKTGTPVQSPPGHRNWHTVVQCINGTGAHLRRGDVVEFDGSALDPLDNSSVWVNGVAVDLSHVGWGIALEPIAYNASAVQTGPVLALGVCVGIVLITDESHKYATRVNGFTTLVSSSSGPAKILHKPAAVGALPEERECLVQIMDEGGESCEIVQVYHPEVTPGNVVEATADGYHPGRIVAVSDEGYATSTDIWIWFVDGFPDDVNLAVQEEYYGPAKPTGETYDYVENEGEEDESHDERPIYVLEFSERQFLCKANSAISKGASDTVTIYHSSSLASSGIEREALALGAPITGGLWCLYFRVAGQWFVSPWECPEE